MTETLDALDGVRIAVLGGTGPQGRGLARASRAQDSTW